MIIKLANELHHGYSDKQLAFVNKQLQAYYGDSPNPEYMKDRLNHINESFGNKDYDKIRKRNSKIEYAAAGASLAGSGLALASQFKPLSGSKFGKAALIGGIGATSVTLPAGALVSLANKNISSLAAERDFLNEKLGGR